jgi:hypothetical protein
LFAFFYFFRTFCKEDEESQDESRSVCLFVRVYFVCFFLFFSDFLQRR